MAMPETVRTSDDDLAVLQAMEALSTLVRLYGAARVQKWLRSIAAVQGEALP